MAFSLEGKGLKLETAAHVEDYVAQIRDLDLEEINLSGNSFGVEAGKALADALKDKINIKVANLSDMFTGRLRSEIPQTLKYICDALTDKEHLVELNLSDNAFGPAGAEPIVDFLTNNTSLQVLRINNNGLGVGGGTIIAKALLANAQNVKAAGKTSSLRRIICGRNRLEDGSSETLAAAFAAHGTLVEVRMPQNGIRPEGIRNITQGLSFCKDLEVLDLQDNTFTEKGSLALAEVMPNWTNLKVLNIGDCLLGKEGGYAIANVLRTGGANGLESLNLSFNEIEADAIAALAEAINDHLSSLTTLELNGNRCSPDHNAVMSVVDALEKHGYGDALDELDEMEEESDEEEEEEDESALEKHDEEEEAKEPTQKGDDEVDDGLVKDLSKVHIS
ncbi:hypothetical protein BZG36_00633 [Bifiguratus adelaidae]|uniref:Ran GTPase-activating protein 1 n=1 Tax=Bifiguratus adelaidae TaxID=1938954 RepID=A0A261Y7F2_9FUNG|nr:hypothetical protein BZG36_00633 [Bifiguratus adelaidae]